MPKLELGKVATAYDANSNDNRPDYQEYRFAKNGSTTSAPSLVKTDAEPSGWTTTQPSVGTLQYLWMTIATKSATGALLTNWSDPVRITPYDGFNPRTRTGCDRILSNELNVIVQIYRICE